MTSVPANKQQGSADRPPPTVVVSGDGDRLALAQKFTAIEDRTKRILTNVGGLTDKIKDNPSLLLRRPEK